MTLPPSPRAELRELLRAMIHLVTLYDSNHETRLPLSVAEEWIRRLRGLLAMMERLGLP